MHRVIAFLAILLLSGVASADAALQFTAPNLRAPDDPDVNGLRFSLFHGDARSIRGLDLGFASYSESDELSGVRLVMGVSRLRGDLDGGVDFSAVNVHSGRDRGVNLAFVNLLNDARNAVDISFLNIADGTTLLDIGGLNTAKESSVQIGFVNVAARITGLQFGFINVAENGFLPVFPFFNFPAK